MNLSARPSFATQMAAETLFRDAYRILEEIQQSSAAIDAVSAVLVHCHRALRNLERIHQNHVRVYGDDPAEDPFQIREPLDRFIATCNAFNYVLDPLVQPAQEHSDSCLLNSQKSWKRKHVKNLEQEFCDHERTLSMVLTNAIYITTLEMQRQGHSHDPALAYILRQVEKRHKLYECLDSAGKESAAQKLKRSRGDDIDWEFCLRRYFDYLESWKKSYSTTPSDHRRSRRLSLSSEPQSYDIRRSATLDPDVAYSSHRALEETDTSRFYRKPRDRNSLRLSSLVTSSNPALNRSRPGGQSLSSTSSSTVVPSTTGSWLESPSLSAPITLPLPSPTIDRAPSSIETPWERLAIDTTGALIEDLFQDFPELKSAHRDIVWETRTMNATEARAYVQGRLAVVSATAINRIKDRLATPQPRPAIMPRISDAKFVKALERSNEDEKVKEHSKKYEMAGNIFFARPSISESLKNDGKPMRAQSLLMATIKKMTDSPPASPKPDQSNRDPVEKLRERERKKREKRTTVPNRIISAPIPLASPNLEAPLPLTPPEVAQVKPLPRAIDSLKSSRTKSMTKPKKSRIASLNFKEIRPLSAISERPYTGRSRKSSRSKGSKVDLSELALDLSKPLPSTRAHLSVTSLELVLEFTSTASTPSPPRSSTGSDKELPPVPKNEKPVQLPQWLAHPSPLGSNPVNTSVTSLTKTFELAAAPKPRKFTAEKTAKISSARMALPSTVVTARQAAARDAHQAQQARLHLTALHDSIEKEFGAWLTALPYIEGTGNKRNSWMALTME